MNSTEYESLASLRLAVGLLGEQGDPKPWWTSNFFGAGSTAFLAPMFSRTLLLAQYHGVLQAAARVHDEHIGVGRVYHLFRLPEDIEYGIHASLQDGRPGSVPDLLDRAAALDRLRQVAAGATGGLTEGPVRVGDGQLLRSPAAWPLVAALYALAFDGGIQVFPYFAELR
jgi:hypothetical protein